MDGCRAVSEPIRVLVVDDQELFRRGLTMVIGALDGIELVGEAGDGRTPSSRAFVPTPTSSCWTCGCPGYSGIETCAELKATMPSVRIVMLTASDEEADLYDAVKSGASGYLLKDASIDEVAQAVRLVADGQSLISPAMAVKLLDEFKQLTKNDRSARGRAAAHRPRAARCCGWSRAARATARSPRDLFISENTVKNHVRNILEKLQLHSRMEAVMYAVRERLLDVP